MLDVARRVDRLRIDAELASESSLRRYAALSESAGDPAAAAVAWRVLSAALDPPAPAWFEARHELIRVLSATDPAEARRALSQHMALYAGAMPGDWDTKFAALERTLGTGRQGATP